MTEALAIALTEIAHMQKAPSIGDLADQERRVLAKIALDPVEPQVVDRLDDGPARLPLEQKLEISHAHAAGRGDVGDTQFGAEMGLDEVLSGSQLAWWGKGLGRWRLTVQPRPGAEKLIDQHLLHQGRDDVAGRNAVPDQRLGRQ